MKHVSAFTDDALGDHDAVALVDALRTGRVSAAEVVEAAIARTEAVNPVLNGLAHATFDRAREQACSGGSGYFDGVPTFFKDNVDVEGMPTMQGTDAWNPVPHMRHGEFAEFYLATGLIPLVDTALSAAGRNTGSSEASAFSSSRSAASAFFLRETNASKATPNHDGSRAA